MQKVLVPKCITLLIFRIISVLKNTRFHSFVDSVHFVVLSCTFLRLTWRVCQGFVFCSYRWQNQEISRAFKYQHHTQGFNKTPRGLKSCTRLRSVLNRAAVNSMTKTHNSVEENVAKGCKSKKADKFFYFAKTTFFLTSRYVCKAYFIRFWVEKDVLKDLKYPSEATIDEMHRSV